jgi:general secretion pathway protein J
MDENVLAPTQEPRTIQSSWRSGGEIQSMLTRVAVQARPGGFTLLEVLLALTIAALLAVTGYRGLSLLLDSDQRLAAQSRQWRSVDQFFARLESDLRKAVPRGVRGSGGDEPALLLAAAGADSGAYATTLRFSRAGGESGAAGVAAGQRIEYRMHGNSIEMVYWPYLDNPPGSEPVHYSLLDGVASFRVRGYTLRGEWADTWPLAAGADVNVLPRALRAELQLESGESLERWFTLQP